MKIQKLGNTYTILQNSEIIDELPVGVFMLTDSNLKEGAPIEVPERIYGDVENKVDYIIKGFNSQNNNLGCLLSGGKGTSKSLTIALLSKKIGLPIINVGGGLEPNTVCDIISSINQEVVVVFDEFDKFYKTHEEQELFLPLFDGILTSKKLFILATNTDNLSEFLINRLGRIRYHFRHGRVSDEVRDEIIQNELQDKAFERELLDVLEIIGDVSIDNLLKFIEEVNLSNKSPLVIAPYMNFSPEDAEFTYIIMYDGKRGEGRTYTHPLSHDKVSGWFQYKKEGQKYPEYINFEFNLENADYHRDEEDRLVIKEGNNTIKYTKVRPFELKFG